MLRSATLFAAILFGPATVSAQQSDHWAFRPLARPAAGNRALRTATTETDRYTLARRLYFDLLGLPPTPAQLVAFVNDLRPDAYERLVERLLASPHFGERWGRHWLDAAGYVDVVGGDNDAATVKLGQRKWLYRDWVIRAFNDDRPFDQFLIDQIAGDELCDWRNAKEYTPAVREKLVATGFLRVAADDTDENELNTLDIRHGVLQRTAETLASNLFGLTFNCAKCHDHKYEPISQRDYYRLIAVLQPAFNPAKWLQPKDRLLDELPAEVRKRNAELARQQEAREVLGKTLSKLGLAKTAEALGREAKDLAGQRRPTSPIHAVYDNGAPTPTHLLKRGDYLMPGDEVRPGFPHALCTSESAAEMTPAPASGSSGRRLALAKWLTAPGTPAEALVLRVRVNRVWRHLFGKGLVEPDNFGVTGSAPVQPELLEWLAYEFRDNGQRLKPLIRLLVTSRLYRQAARSPRRIESEAVRDALLCVGGNLDVRIGSEPLPAEARPDGALVVKGDGSAATSRRSVYVLTRRNYHPTLLGVFDQPTVATNCTGRQPSAVVLQSLTMLNDAFVREQAERFAKRVRAEAGVEASRQIEDAFLIALSRPPRAQEIEWCRDFLARRGLPILCHTLLNTSEFLYIP
jgi:hypothetical protein